MPGSARFYSDDKSKCPDNVRFKGQEKHPKMVTIWVAKSPRSMSKPVFYRFGSPYIDSPIYIDKCLQKSLPHFIQEHHADSNYILWPDLASAHYSG